MELASARRVAILAAMVPELAPVVRGLALRPVAVGGTRTYAGRAGDVEVVATVTTMGTRAARDATERLLDAYAVDHVVMLGVCGGIDRGLGVGDLVVPEQVIDETSGRAFRPAPLGGATARGTLLTTDRLHRDPVELDTLRSRGVVAVDMESAAVGAVAEERGIRWSVSRAVSDRAGDPDVDEELVAMSNPDGTARPAAVLRFVLRRPRRIVALARLGAGLRAAVKSSTAPVLAALRRP